MSCNFSSQRSKYIVERLFKPFLNNALADTFADAFTKKNPAAKSNIPPSVSKLGLERFEVDYRMQVSHLFPPELTNTTKESHFMELLMGAVVSLCSVATIHTEKVHEPKTTAHLVITYDCRARCSDSIPVFLYRSVIMNRK